MRAKNLLLERVKDGSFALLTYEEIASLLHLGRRERFAVRDMLLSLVSAGELLCDGRGRFGTAKQFGAKRGIFGGNERGFGFFTPEDGSDPLYIPRRSVNGALHGDDVLAFQTGGKNGDEGEILAIVSRGMREVVGEFRREGRGGYLIPDEKKFNGVITISPQGVNGCPNGAKAVAKITSYGEYSLHGEIQEVFGRSGELFAEEAALIRSHGLRTVFPQAVLTEAEHAAAQDISPHLSGRLDLRDTCIVTVDGEDTRDIDDAISLTKTGKTFHLGVHIADVSHYVPFKSQTDEEAFARGTSVYFPDRVLPMLPPSLSNGSCSLNEGEDRLTLSCLAEIDEQGRVLKAEFHPSVIRSRHRLTYDEVDGILEGGKARERYPDLVGFFTDAAELTAILRRARAARGEVDLEIRETDIRYRDGEISIPPTRRTLSHDMIEQFMVTANECVAREMEKRGFPFVYRIHERPATEKAETFRTFLHELGIPAPFDPSSVSPADYRDVLKRLEGSPVRPVVHRIMLRSMMKAAYSPDNVGHFGLASASYCHFTSPIRRYPDLCVHRILKAALSEGDGAKAKFKDIVKNVAMQSSARERTAAEAERDVDDLYAAAFMRNHIGESFMATISGVSSYGLFAELENGVEGFLPIETLPDDAYEYHETRFLLRGTRNTYRLGDEIRVRVDGVDLGARRTRFSPESV